MLKSKILRYMKKKVTTCNEIICIYFNEESIKDLPQKVEKFQDEESNLDKELVR